MGATVTLHPASDSWMTVLSIGGLSSGHCSECGWPQYGSGGGGVLILTKPYKTCCIPCVSCLPKLPICSSLSDLDFSSGTLPAPPPHHHLQLLTSLLPPKKKKSPLNCLFTKLKQNTWRVNTTLSCLLLLLNLFDQNSPGDKLQPG